MKSIIILIAFIGIVDAQEPTRQNFLVIGQIGLCKGKDAGNYTFISQFSEDANCSLDNVQNTGIVYLTANQQNGEKVVNILSILAQSIYPAGAYFQYDALYLATIRNLAGKYLYLKQTALVQPFLKKCSSVLGSSYTSTKSQVLLIAEKLDPNVFINPTGAFEPFKKCATTTCQGNSIFV